MERHSADTNNAESENAAMKAEIDALWRRIAALEREAGQPQSAPAEGPRRDAPRRALPGNRNDSVALQPDPAGRIARRRILGLGALVSLLTFIGRSAARAADALTIDGDGVVIFAGKRNNFTDEEHAGKLRVGAAWGVPGIYSEQGPIIVGSQNGNIWLNGKVGIGADKKAPSQNLDVAGTIAAQNLAVTGAVTAGKLTAAGPMEINGKNTLSFGVGNAKNDLASGTIGYQVHTPDALDIVGAGDGGKPRKIKLWAEGGTTLNGGLTVSGSATVGALTVSGGGGTNVDLTVNGRLRSNNNDGGLWVTEDRFVGGFETNKIGFWNKNGGWRLAVRNDGQIEVMGPLFVHGGLNYWWGPDKQWKNVQNRANDYAGSYTTGGPSDIRFKTALRPIDDALAKILQLNGRYYRWSEAGLSYFTRDIADGISAGPDATEADNQKLWDDERAKAYETLSGDRIGLIAQELETAVPELVHEDKQGYKYIRYEHLTAVLVEAIKEQHALIQSLSGRLAALEARWNGAFQEVDPDFGRG